MFEFKMTGSTMQAELRVDGQPLFAEEINLRVVPEGAHAIVTIADRAANIEIILPEENVTMRGDRFAAIKRMLNEVCDEMKVYDCGISPDAAAIEDRISSWRARLKDLL